MASTLEEQLGVATGGAHWDVGGFRLWQTTVPDVIFFAPRELRLAPETGGRYRAALTEVQRWRSGTYEVTGGSIVLGVFGDTADGAEIGPLADQWRRVLLNTGYKASTRPRFLPLPVRDARVSAVIDASHTPDGKASGATREGRTLVLNLTAAGAREWARAVRREGVVKGSIRLTYEYPQLLPRSTAAVTINGARVYSGVAADLHKAADGWLYGSLDEIRDTWLSLVRSGAVRIALTESSDAPR